MKKRFHIENIDCANCAAKVEHAISELDGVDAVSLQFVQKTLVLEAADDRFAEVLAAAKKKAAELEPDMLILEDAPSVAEAAKGLEPEQKTALARIIAAAVLLVIAWLLPLSGIAKLIAFLVPYLVAGYPVLRNALRNIRHGQIFDEALLMTLATVGAFAIGEYPEAAFVMIFFQVGELFEDIAVGKSRRSIAGLMDIRPDAAVVVREGKELTVKPEEVAVGELIRVIPGARIPLDGVITEGKTTVHTAALTGESAPVAKSAGDQVLSGMINQSGAITVRVESCFAESTVSKILALVESAAEKKSKAERFITRFSRIYTPAVVICAVLLALIPPLCFGQPWGSWLHRACVFLMVSCPCALVVSVPLSFFGGIGGASRYGVLIKGANDLERLAEVDTVVFDKTGTLTHGEFAVDAIHPKECTADELLDIAAAAEQRSTHPVGESIIRAHNGHLDPARLTEVTELAGRGLHVTLDGKPYDIGNGKLMDEIGADWHDCHLSGTVIHIAAAGEYLGHIVINDRVKHGAKSALSQLKTLGIRKTVMLTGDLQAVADDVGKAVGIDELHAELLPADKVTQVEQIMQSGAKTAFVGDGINDAPVLMRADVGVAMGAMGSDAAMEAADIVLMDDSLQKLGTAIATARKTMRIVRENIIFALAVKFLILILGAFTEISLWLAMFGDVGVLILAVLNALRAMQPAAAPGDRHEHEHEHGHHHHDHDDDCCCGHDHDHEHHHHDHDDDDDDDCCCGHDHDHAHHHHDHDDNDDDDDCCCGHDHDHHHHNHDDDDDGDDCCCGHDHEHEHHHHDHDGGDEDD